MTNKKSVLLLITRLDRGGSADATLHLARGLVECGYKVLLVSGKTVEPSTDLQSYGTASGFQLVMLNSLVRQLNPWLDLITLIKLYGLIVHFRPQVLHTNTSKAGFLGRLVGYIARVPRIVHSDHGHIFYGYYNQATTRFFISLEKLAAHWCDLVLNLTASGRRDYIRAKVARPEKFTVSLIGTDLGPFLATPLPCYPDFGKGERFKIAWVGRLVPVKNPPLLLETAALLQAAAFPADFQVIGDGEEMDATRRRATALHLENMNFLGYRSDVAALLCRCHLFVFTSLNEGFGIVIIEAMACGLPVVGTSVGGTPDLIEQHRNGLLVESNNAPALCAAIQTVLNDPILWARLGAQNRKKAEFYSITNYIRRVQYAYGEHDQTIK